MRGFKNELQQLPPLQRLQLLCMLIKQSFSFGSSLTSFLTYEVNTVSFFYKLKLNVKEQRGVRK